MAVVGVLTVNCVANTASFEASMTRLRLGVAGKFGQLKDTISELMVQIGNALKPLTTGALEGFTKFIEYLKEIRLESVATTAKLVGFGLAFTGSFVAAAQLVTIFPKLLSGLDSQQFSRASVVSVDHRKRQPQGR